MGLLAIWALIGGVGDGEERVEHGSLPFVPPAFKPLFYGTSFSLPLSS